MPQPQTVCKLAGLLGQLSSGFLSSNETRLMTTQTPSGAAASTVSLARQSDTGTSIDLPDSPPQEMVRHLVFGSLSAVQACIKDLHRLKYAEPNDWSRPLSTGRPNEVMAILTRRVTVS